MPSALLHQGAVARRAFEAGWQLGQCAAHPRAGARFAAQALVDALHQWEECGTPAEGGERLSAECRRRTVADACQWMERHLPERFSAAELSCAVHVSVRSLQYGSQEELGCTPMAHAKRLRLRRLRRSLQDQHHRGVDGCINM